MSSKVGKDSQPTATMIQQPLPRGIDQSYGAMATIMKYLPRFEQLRLQGLDKWWYIIGVSRVQWYFELPKLFYFVQDTQILAVAETGEQQKFSFRGDPGFSNAEWISCQVGRSRLFQCKYGIFRILKVDPSQRSFTVEKSGARPEKTQVWSLTNLKDQFIFLFNRSGLPRRYSLAEDRWEELPPRENSNPRSACSLGDKVYVFADNKPYLSKNQIHVLHNPDAPISSQEPPRWQVIDVPEDVVSFSHRIVASVPLNSTEIAILGGRDGNVRILVDIITFHTSTCEFKTELKKETDSFRCHEYQPAQVCENTIIALATGQNHERRLIKYTKGDTFITHVPLKFD